MIRSQRDGARSSNRAGVALLVAIVCVSIAAAVMVSLVHVATRAYRETNLQARRAQARLLAESAIDRAAARLAADAEYSGETWTLAAQDLGTRHGAEVRVRVETLEGKAGWRLVEVVADYPVESSQRVRERRTCRIRLNP